MILDEICALSRKRASEITPEVLNEAQNTAYRPKNLLKAVKSFQKDADKNAVIAEIKYKAPSDKSICSDKSPKEIAGIYEKGGAVAVSVLTEPFFFNGCNDNLAQAKSGTKLPLLRKDFIVDEKQIQESYAIKADSLLLISAVLDKRLKSFIDLSRSFSIEPLVEVRTLSEAENAINSGALLCGINNRNLKTMTVDTETTKEISAQIRDAGLTLISESGIKTPEDICRLKSCCDGFLIGTSLMKSENPKKTLEGFVFA